MFEKRGAGYLLGRAWFVLYSVRKNCLGLAAGVPETHQESPHTHLMGGYQAKGAGHSVGKTFLFYTMEEACA